jgi:2-oxoglutarate dehydrogenase E1 component
MSDKLRYPNTLSLPFVERLYADYLRNPAALPEDWREFFSHISHPNGGNGAGIDEQDNALVLQQRVDQLVHSYRVRGHRVADLDPLGAPRPLLPELQLEIHGLTEADLDRAFSCPMLTGSSTQNLPLREIVRRLQATYCRTIGVEFMHIDEPGARAWLQNRMESTQNRMALTREEQIRILTRLTDAVVFEEFIRKRFIGAKTFSLEGGESLIPLLDLAIEKAGSQGVRDIVLAMAHRGRLSVLANIMAKNPRWIFREFADADPDESDQMGDVKHHLGYASDWVTREGKRIHLSLCFNPSHLEFVDPVAVGRVRAKQDRAGDLARQSAMALLIHGDASFAGEGIIQESLNLSGLDGYNVGGALHVILNNQIGYTTLPPQSRSTIYCSDVAKMLRTPIFHVNGEDPEAVIQVVGLAMDFRNTFRKDVVIDLYCYRKLGHNEGDEPSFTQPLLYREISARKSVREGYLDRLTSLGEITRDDGEGIVRRRIERLNQEMTASEDEETPHQEASVHRLSTGADIQVAENGADIADAQTGVDKTILSNLLEGLVHMPADFHVHPKLQSGLQRRMEMAQEKRPLDWAGAEALALAALAREGVRIRMTGQDSERGTFSQRHAVLHDFQDGHTYTPLQHIGQGQGPVEIFNSPLSEAGVLGFEYGYSLDCPHCLVIWEAQYGDFFNAAQVIVDQFIVSAEEKWRQLSGITLLLPHGFEGGGPEHSSARLERFLELAAEDNIQIVCPTTPAQYFHALRRQVVSHRRKPLILMTPKSLLRHPRVVSSLEDCAGAFKKIIPDSRPVGATTRRVALCSGKIYYELEKARDEGGHTDVAILRIEQLYPLDMERLEETLISYPAETPIVWVQEEPENMGAWRYLRIRFGERLLGRFPFSVISRAESASPATGSASSHKKEQGRLLAEVFQPEL